MHGKQFSSNKEVIAAVEANFDSYPDGHSGDGIPKIEDDSNKYVKIQEEYIE